MKDKKRKNKMTPEQRSELNRKVKVAWWKKQTQETKTAHASYMVKKRWANKTPEERIEYGKMLSRCSLEARLKRKREQAGYEN